MVAAPDVPPVNGEQCMASAVEVTDLSCSLSTEEDGILKSILRYQPPALSCHHTVGNSDNGILNHIRYSSPWFELCRRQMSGLVVGEGEMHCVSMLSNQFTLQMLMQL